MTDWLIFLIAIIAISLALLVDRYFAWREWDARRRRERAFVRALKRSKVHMRLLGLTISVELVPAVRQVSRAFSDFGHELGKVRPPDGNA